MSGAMMDIDALNASENLTEWNITSYVAFYRGPQSLPLEVSVPLTVINLLIFVSGLLGNIAVCVVIIRHSNMHTATNYYLFNLAVSDLMLLIFGLPNDVLVYWQQYPWVLGETFCKLRALLSEMASYVSVLTIVAFSTERCLSICYPLYLYTMSGLQRAIRIICVLWIVSFFSALPWAVYIKVNYLERHGHIVELSAVCAMLQDPPVPLGLLSTITFFIIPMIIIAVQYTMMGLKISNRTQSFGQNCKGSVHRDSRKSQSHKAIIRMLAVVVIAFFVCWAPFHAQRLWYTYGQNSEHFSSINEYLFYITGLLYYFSSTLNPILYNIMSNRYRTAFKEILCGYKPHKNVITSTIRETRLPSQSNSEKNDKNKFGNAIDDDDETMVLVHKRDIVLSSPKGKNTLIYQVNYSDIKPNSETCI